MRKLKFGEKVLIRSIPGELFYYMKEMGDGSAEVFGPFDFSIDGTPMFGINTVGRVKTNEIYRV